MITGTTTQPFCFAASGSTYIMPAPIRLKIAIDFDGTLYHNGNLLPSPKFIKDLSQHHDLILHTTRNAQQREDALVWLSQFGVRIHAVNVAAGQKDWTDSSKCFADLYIDDRSVGIPLKQIYSEEHYYHVSIVDWSKLIPILKKGIERRTYEIKNKK